ncbi:MAG: hypothetical protein JNJ85_07590, partial [Candidatus Kapabacteria bacterium]|nr:hypothetical protein [Candidatus Kapabacteria bacterium]
MPNRMLYLVNKLCITTAILITLNNTLVYSSSDTAKSYKFLEVTHVEKIIEPDSLTLTAIAQIEVSSKYAALYDNRKSEVHVYMLNGSHKYSLFGSDSLVDIFANTQPCIFKGYSYIAPHLDKDVDGNKIPNEFINTYLRNKFMYSTFENTDLYTVSGISYYCVDTTSSNRGKDNARNGEFFSITKSTLENNYVTKSLHTGFISNGWADSCLALKYSFYPSPNKGTIAFFNDDTLVIPLSFHLTSKAFEISNLNDTIYTLAMYNLNTGKWKEFEPLPIEYINSKIAYKRNSWINIFPLVNKKTRNIYYTTSLLPQVNIVNNRFFKLKGFENKNSSFFELCKSNDLKSKQINPLDSINFMITGCKIHSDNLIVYGIDNYNYKSINQQIWFIQEYTDRGELIKDY